MTPSIVLDTYWRFAVERQAMFFRRLMRSNASLTEDPILSRYRFTNTFRANDRVSQYLIRDVQYREDRSQAPAEVFFRTILFKIFNRIETWEALEKDAGPISWERNNLDKLVSILDRLMLRGQRVYSAAYIMPAPQLGHVRKHANHLALVDLMMRNGLPSQIQQALSLREVYETLLKYPGLGPFLAYQYAIDLNYSTLFQFSESDFVVAGPGAIDGISKCFLDTGGKTPQEIIEYVTDNQDNHLTRLGLKLQSLFGRKLQLIDCQNIFCEVSKYARIAHPDVPGVSGRKRIKQSYKPSDRALPAPFYPPKWKVNLPVVQ